MSMHMTVRMYRHVYTHAYRHVIGHVYGYVYRYVCGHAYRLVELDALWLELLLVRSGGRRMGDN